MGKAERQKALEKELEHWEKIGMLAAENIQRLQDIIDSDEKLEEMMRNPILDAQEPKRGRKQIRKTIHAALQKPNVPSAQIISPDQTRILILELIRQNPDPVAPMQIAELLNRRQIWISGGRKISRTKGGRQRILANRVANFMQRMVVGGELVKEKRGLYSIAKTE